MLNQDAQTNLEMLMGRETRFTTKDSKSIPKPWALLMNYVDLLTSRHYGKADTLERGIKDHKPITTISF